MDVQIQGPVTATITGTVEDEENPELQRVHTVWIGRAPYFRPSSSPSWYDHELMLPIRSDAREFNLSAIETNEPNLLKGTTWPSGFDIEVRPTMERDVVGSVSVPSDIPLPLQAIEQLVSDVNTDFNVELQGLVDEQGTVATLLLLAAGDLYVRYSRAWVPVIDYDVLDGFDVFDLRSGALTLYDAQDEIGRSISILSMPLDPDEDDSRLVRYAPDDAQLIAPPPNAEVAANAGTATDPASETTVEDDEEAVVGSALPVLGTKEELLEALTASNIRVSQRWYFERRAVALGVDLDELPWKES